MDTSTSKTSFLDDEDVDTGSYTHYDGEGVLLREPFTKVDVVKIALHHSTETVDGRYLLTFPNLRTLDLSGTRVRDLSPLKELTSLTTLVLSYTHVIDLSPLEGLTSLTTLDLSDTHVRDLSPLKELTSLTTLDLSSTHVIDLSPLKELTSLTKLYLRYTKVGDLSPLKGLTSLTTLGLPTYVVSGFTAIVHVDNVYTNSLNILVVDDEGDESTVKAPASIQYNCTGTHLLAELYKVHGWYDRSSGTLTKRACV